MEEIGTGRLWDDLLLRFTQLPPSPSVNFLILSSPALSLFLSSISHPLAFLHGPCTESPPLSLSLASSLPLHCSADETKPGNREERWKGSNRWKREDGVTTLPSFLFWIEANCLIFKSRCTDHRQCEQRTHDSIVPQYVWEFTVWSNWAERKKKKSGVKLIR